jgi:long-chain acyl-CoA synthetase
VKAAASSSTGLLELPSGDGLALVYGDDRLSWSELGAQVDGLAGALAARGLGSGAPIALVLPNVPAFVVAFLAIQRAGGVAVPLNPHFKEAELEFHFRDSGVRAVITDAEGAPVCQGVAARLESPPEVFPSIEPLVAEGGDLPAAPGPEDDAVFQYSSGSTGRPKRVPRTHRHLKAEADAYVGAIGLSAEDSIFCTIALFHTYGMGCCLLAAVRAGATLVVFDNPNPFVLQRGRALALLERERCTVFPGVPFTFRVLAEAPEEADLSSLRLAFSAAAALPRSTFAAFRERFEVPVRQLYGCTEAGCVTVNVDDDAVATSGSVGTPIEGVELRIVDESGAPVDAGRIGDVLIRGAGMTPGYADAGELNAEAFRDGWFASGDRGRLDEQGRLVLTGRVKRLIDVRGDKVDPVEVEDVLAVHPKVAEVVVLGVESDVPGEETIKAVVVPAGEANERELIRYCRERLADYKVPSRVEFREEIPRGPGGKVQRSALLD